MRHLLVVNVPRSIFDAYWYGAGTVLCDLPAYVVDYGADRFRAEYQRDRFLSGMYAARVVEVGAADAPLLTDADETEGRLTSEADIW